MCKRSDNNNITHDVSFLCTTHHSPGGLTVCTFSPQCTHLLISISDFTHDCFPQTFIMSNNSQFVMQPFSRNVRQIAGCTCFIKVIDIAICQNAHIFHGNGETDLYCVIQMSHKVQEIVVRNDLKSNIVNELNVHNWTGLNCLSVDMKRNTLCFPM